MMYMFVRNLGIGGRLLCRVFIRKVIIIKVRKIKREQIEVEFKKIKNLIINNIKIKLNKG